MQVLEYEVAKIAMRIVDQHFRRTACDGAFDGRVRFGGHQAARSLVFGIAGTRLLGVDDTGNAFDVDRDENPHWPASSASQSGATSASASRT